MDIASPMKRLWKDYEKCVGKWKSEIYCKLKYMKGEKF
jgi:hypothetical protein